jgi:hypothetical protein
LTFATAAGRVAHSMRVSVSGKQFVFPRSCACCGSFPLTSITVSGTERNRLARTKGWLWDIPHCAHCKRHVRASEALLVAAIVLLGISVLSAFLKGVFTGSYLIGLQILFLISIGSLLLLAVPVALQRSWRTKTCTAFTRSVSYLGSSGSCHTFEIKRRFYAVEFVRDNHRKLVNVSAEVASILRDTRSGNYQVPRRLVHKRR